MTFGELLTKVAIVVTAWSTWKSELFVSRTAIIFAGVLLLLSFLRDANLRVRGIVRMAPTFGSVCLASVAIFLFLTEGYRWACHLVFMKPEESIMGGCWTALGVQCITMMSEAGTRRAFDYMCGTDEGYFDRIQGRSYSNRQQQWVQNHQQQHSYQVSCSSCNTYNNDNMTIVDAPRIAHKPNIPLIPRR